MMGHEEIVGSLLRPIIIGTMILGGFIGLLGVILVYLGAKGYSHLLLFGQSIETADVGVASLSIAAILVILILRRTLKTIDDMKVTKKASFQDEKGRRVDYE